MDQVDKAQYVKKFLEKSPLIEPGIAQRNYVEISYILVKRIEQLENALSQQNRWYDVEKITEESENLQELSTNHSSPD